MLRIGRRLISSSATTARIIQPGAAASTSPSIVSEVVRSDTISQNVESIADNAAVTAADSASMYYTHLMANDLCLWYTPFGLAQNLVYMIHSVSAMPWWTVLAATGFMAPTIQEAIMRHRQTYTDARQLLLENSDLVLKWMRLTGQKMTAASSYEMAEIRKEMDQKKIPLIPQLTYLAKSASVPVIGTWAVQRMFNPTTTELIYYNDTTWSELNVCQTDPSYLIALPIIYLNFYVFKELRILRAQYADSAYPILKTLMAGVSLYHIMTPCSIATTIFLSSYAAGLWPSNKLFESSLLRRGSSTERKRLPFIQNGFYRPINRWQSFKEVWRAMQ